MLTRRDFVKASSVALAVPSLLRAAGQDRTYRACVIGHTGRGGYGHVTSTCFQRIPRVTVAGVADPDEEGRRSVARQTGAARAYADYREMKKATTRIGRTGSSIETRRGSPAAQAPDPPS